MHQPKRKRYLTTRKLSARQGVSPRTLDRRLKDPELGYPPPDMIKGRRYWDEEKIEAWEAKQAAAGAPVLSESCARCSAACTDGNPWFNNNDNAPCFVCSECAPIVGAAMLGEVVGIDGDDDEEWPLSAAALERNNNAHAARQRQYQKNRKLGAAP